MRILICDDHAVFAESLAHLLTTRGMQVVAVTYRPDQAAAALRRDPVDVAVLDLMFGSESVLSRIVDMRRIAPQTRFVVLCARIDEALLAAARAGRLHGIGEKSQPVESIMEVLHRVHGGGTALPVLTGGRQTSDPAGTEPGRTAAEHTQWLAEFLTPREREVLGGLVRGEDTMKLARRLGIAQATARCHIQAVLTKLGAHSRLEAATTAVRHGMVNPVDGGWLTPADQ